MPVFKPPMLITTPSPWLTFQTSTLKHLSNAAMKRCNTFHDLKTLPEMPSTTISSERQRGYIHLKDFSNAIDCLHNVLESADHGKYSFLMAHLYLAITGLHAGKIDLSTRSIEETEAYWPNLPENIQEQWKIVKAYTALFSEKKYKIGKFINEVPIFSKDKAGANASIIIVQMLHYLKMGKTHQYIERCDALSSYMNRHLKGKIRILAKLLLEVNKGRFNALTVKYRT